MQWPTSKVVGSFRRYLQEWGERYPGGVELLAAKFVGRWRDVTPLELSPHAMDVANATDRQRQNDFKYADDPDGLRLAVIRVRSTAMDQLR
jgi:hypothetical protein